MKKRLYVSFSALANHIKNGISLEELDSSLYAMFFTCREMCLGQEGLHHMQRKLHVVSEQAGKDIFYQLEGTLLFAEQDENRVVWVERGLDGKVNALNNFLVGKGLKPLNKHYVHIDNYTTLEKAIRETNPELDVVWRLR